MGKDKKITLIIGGGIAAYKSLELIRLLQNAHIEVIPILTKSAENFVTTLSLAAISKKKVYSHLFDLNDETEMGHIQLSRVSDLIVVAPATANLISKMANGLADDLASTLILATNKKVLIAPSMNVQMWNKPATLSNVKKLKEYGFLFIGPNTGDMACGEFGPGRMAEPSEIKDKIMASFQKNYLLNKKILVTSGPTVERIDPIRFISNNSSGLQGTAIANALVNLGAEVVFVTGPTNVSHPIGAKIIPIESAKDMYKAVFSHGPYDVAICAAAVSDWHVQNDSSTKIKKQNTNINPHIALKENPDILADLSKSKNRPGLVIGFAAETEQLTKNAKEKLISKGCDLIVANKIEKKSSIFGTKNNEVTIITNDYMEKWPEMTKTEIGEKLGQLIVKYCH